jgi:RalA-binding protein 1
MPQLALQSQSVEASAASAASAINSVTTPVESNFLDRARSPVEVPVGDSPTVGRIIRASPSLPSFSLGPLSPGSR